MANTWAVEPFTVRDIRVEGLQRVEPGTCSARCPSGWATSTTTTRARPRSGPVRLGLFKDVRLERRRRADRGGRGAAHGGRRRLRGHQGVRQGHAEEGAARDRPDRGPPFDQALADRAEQELKRQYINRSLYGAEVVTTVTPIERNRVNLTFTVTEGEPARIKDIHIVGNKTFSESTLKDLMDLDTGGWLSWYTKSDRYSRAPS